VASQLFETTCTVERSIETKDPRDLGTSDLRYLVKLSVRGAAAIVCPRYRTAWVCSGKSVLGALGRILDTLQEGSHPCEKFQQDYRRDWPILRALSGEPQESYRTLWYELDSEGYQVLSRPPATWKVFEEVIPDPRSGRDFGRYLVGVYLRSSSGKKVLAGVFEEVWAARTWIALSYPEGIRIDEPIVSQDRLTLEVLDLLGRAPSLDG